MSHVNEALLEKIGGAPGYEGIALRVREYEQECDALIECTTRRTKETGIPQAMLSSNNAGMQIETRNSIQNQTQTKS